MTSVTRWRAGPIQQEMMRRTSLAWLSIVMACSSLAAQTGGREARPVDAASASSQQVGLLLGVADRDLTSDYYPTQQLRTYWIAVSSTGASRPVTMTGLVVPRDEGFGRVEVRRVCEKMPRSEDEKPADADDDNEDCEDRIVTSGLDTVAKAEPVALDIAVVDLPTPCSYKGRFVTFASPTLLAVQALSGGSERCEPRGYSWTESAEVLRMGTLEPVRFSELTGERGRRAYASAAVRARRQWKREQVEAGFDGWGPDSCSPDEQDDTQWYVMRQGGKWAPMFQQQPGNGLCGMSASINAALSPSALGFPEPTVPRRAVRARFPRAYNVHVSPDRQLWLLEVGDDLVLTRASGGPPLATLPGASVVMVQWAIGSHVARWDRVFEPYR